MLQRVKTYLGVEGVRLSLTLVGEVDRDRGELRGEITLDTQQAQVVTALQVWLTERYAWGRGERRRIESYELGRLTEATRLELNRDEQVVLPFLLSFVERKSAVDEFANRSRLLRPLARAARLTMSAESTYTLYARAKVGGVALDPAAELLVSL